MPTLAFASVKRAIPGRLCGRAGSPRRHVRVRTLCYQLIVTFIGAEISRIVFGTLLIFVMIFLPNGIIEYLRPRRA